MKLLFIGDIVGEPGRAAVSGLCRLLCERHKLDYVIANGENIAGGSGLTLQTVRELLDGGVDIVTSGDHVWDQKEFVADIGKEPRILRPANYPAGVPGSGSIVMIVATDAPLLPHQCRRLAQRAGLGMARTGGYARNSSGDFILAFATGNRSLGPGAGTGGRAVPGPRPGTAKPLLRWTAGEPQMGAGG